MLSEGVLAVVSWCLGVTCGLLGIPIALLLIEVIAAMVRDQSVALPSADPRPSVAVLVPAHNESQGLWPTIATIQVQLRAGDRLLVVADNCSDDTAAVARAAGVVVVERNDVAKVGKGYALDWGLHHLRERPPDVVVIVDADCRVAVGAIDQLVNAAASAGRPVQALNLMVAPSHSAINYQVAEFAWRLKNWVRPLGLRALGLPCQLSGTGMAIPWGVICGADLASGHIVEDLKLGLDLAARGRAPMFCPSAVVTSEFPQSARGAETQRQRWEHGHIAMLLTAPSLIARALARGNWRLLALALDMAVPPLGLLGLLTLVATSITGLAAVLGLSSWLPFLVCASVLTSLAAAVCLAWLTHGRDVLPPAALLSLGPFMLGKFALYARLLCRGAVSQWIRTDRR